MTRGRPRFRVGGGLGALITALARSREVKRDRIGERAHGLAGERRVAGHVDPAARMTLRDQSDQHGGEVLLGGAPLGVRAILRWLGGGLPQPEQHRQTPGALTERRDPDDQAHDDEAVAVLEPAAQGGRAVVVPHRTMDLRSRAPEHAAINGQADHAIRVDEPRDQEVQQAQAQLIGRPARPGEEVMADRVMHTPGEPGGLPHAAHGALPDPTDHSGHQRLERLKRRGGERGAQQGQQLRQRRWQHGHRR